MKTKTLTKLTTLILVAFFTYAHAQSFGPPDPDAIGVSYLRLVSMPEEFHEKKIQTVAFIYATEDDGHLYLYYMPDFHRTQDFRNIVLLSLEQLIDGINKESRLNMVDSFSDKQILVEGTFNYSGSEKYVQFGSLEIKVSRMVNYSFLRD